MIAEYSKWGVAILSIHLSACTGSAAEATEVEAQAVTGSHLITGVPWHEQQNGLFCGPGTLEMLLDFWGTDVNQKAIADVARSASAGTWCPDMVRTGQFSWNSAAQGRYFQHDAPSAGFDGHHLGYGAFEHSQDTPWLSGIKATVDTGLPVIALVTFDAEGGGGHFRTIVGYDDALGVLYLLDPWGRDQNHSTGSTGMVAWTYAEFLSSWNYQDALNPHPFWATVMVPWSVSLQVQGPTNIGAKPKITANISYTCPAAFDCNTFPASNVAAALSLPPGMTLLEGATNTTLGNLAAGASTSVTWKVSVNQNPAGQRVSVTASGWISGSVPEAHWNGESVSYPAYSYSDQIGGSAELTF
jgi:hypothetical protein